MDDRQKLLDILRDIDDEIDYENETALVDDGLIDSLDLTQILAAVSETFGIRIPAGRIEPENFNSVSAMLLLIDRCRAEK